MNSRITQLALFIALAVTIVQCATPDNHATMVNIEQKVTVWDTYVNRSDNHVMHFDILAPVDITDMNTITAYGQDYLKSKGVEGARLTSEECRRCHVETLRPEWADSIAVKGYYIIEMEGCN